MEINTEFIESAKIISKQMLCLDMSGDYLTISYIGDIDCTKHFIWNMLSVTEGGGSLTSYLLSIDEMKERIQDLTRFTTNKDVLNTIQEYLKFK